MDKKFTGRGLASVGLLVAAHNPIPSAQPPAPPVVPEDDAPTSRVQKTGADYCRRLADLVGFEEAADLIGISLWALRDGINRNFVNVSWEGAARAHWQDRQPAPPITQIALISYTNPNVLDTLRKLAVSFDFAVHQID